MGKVWTTQNHWMATLHRRFSTAGVELRPAEVIEVLQVITGEHGPVLAHASAVNRTRIAYADAALHVPLERGLHGRSMLGRQREQSNYHLLGTAGVHAVESALRHHLPCEVGREPFEPLAA